MPDDAMREGGRCWRQHASRIGQRRWCSHAAEPLDNRAPYGTPDSSDDHCTSAGLIGNRAGRINTDIARHRRECAGFEWPTVRAKCAPRTRRLGAEFELSRFRRSAVA